MKNKAKKGKRTYYLRWEAAIKESILGAEIVAQRSRAPTPYPAISFAVMCSNIFFSVIFFMLRLIRTTNRFCLMTVILRWELNFWQRRSPGIPVAGRRRRGGMASVAFLFALSALRRYYTTTVQIG